MPVWHPEKRDLQRLDSALAAPLRAVLGLPRTAHIPSMFVESDLPCVEVSAQAQALRYAHRVNRLDAAHPSVAALATPLELLQPQSTTWASSARHHIRDASAALHLPIASIHTSSDISAASRSAMFHRWQSGTTGIKLLAVRQSPGIREFHACDTWQVIHLRQRLRFDVELLRHYAAKIKIRRDAGCWCGEWDPDGNCPARETREHFLLHCRKYAAARDACIQSLHYHGAEFSIPVLLGEPPAELSKRRRRCVLHATHDFLASAWAARWAGITPASSHAPGAFARNRNRLADFS
jgi:hypothetical protein